MKARFATALCLFAATSGVGSLARAQVAFSNSGDPNDPGVVTGFVSRSGLAAPSGSLWSEVAVDAAGANSLAGVSCHSLGAGRAFRVADDCTLVATTELRSMLVFGYSTDNSMAPVNGGVVRIWSGTPDAPGSTIAFEASGPGLLLSQSAISVFRIFSSSTTPLPPVPDMSRPVWAIELATPTTLVAGTYWIEIELTPSNPDAPLFLLPLRPTTGRSNPGWNALQRSAAGAWAPILDAAKPRSAIDAPVDLAFQLFSGFTCPGDWDGSGSPDSDDIIAFFADWESGNGDADGSGSTDSDDIIAFFASWDSGC